MSRLLLISNSIQHGRQYLDHVEEDEDEAVVLKGGNPARVFRLGAPAEVEPGDDLSPLFRETNQ